VVADAIATHHHLAGDTARALRWALDAARAAGAAGDDDTRLRMLRRALVFGDGSLTSQERVALLDEVRGVADRAGDWAAEVEAVEGLIDLLDGDVGRGREESHRLRLAELLVRRNYLLLNLTQGVTDGDTARALRLTEGSHGSDARRLALGAHADNLIWAGLTEQARPLVEEALRGDPPSVPPPEVDTWGSPALRSWAVALRAASTLAEDDEETERSRHLAGRAADLALAAGDLCVFVVEAAHEADMGHPSFARPFVDRIEACRARLDDAGGAPHYETYLTNSAALALFITGRPQECATRIRAVLGSDHAAFGEVRARRTAALLAAAQGREAEAEAHLERATELAPELATDPNVGWCWCRATVSVMAGDAEGAVEAALAGRSSRVPKGFGCEWLLPIAARGLADLAQAERDRGGDPATVLRRLDDVVARDPEVIADVTARDDVYGPVLDGLQALYEAECARARGSEGAAEAWVVAAERLARTELAWDLAYARWRAGEALLAHGGGEERRAAAEHLREGHTLATRLGAQPVLDAIEALARSARIRLDPVEATADASGNGILTRREREVLAGVVAGRTYAEIADDLFVSEKTVSSHISNILRKTGTANRVELASWAARTEQRS
jgi:DNA-binding CsgD family transcriptional regulator/tetratricopeptide (TPR) repeat protein